VRLGVRFHHGLRTRINNVALPSSIFSNYVCRQGRLGKMNPRGPLRPLQSAQTRRTTFSDRRPRRWPPECVRWVGDLGDHLHVRPDTLRGRRMRTATSLLDLHAARCHQRMSNFGCRPVQCRSVTSSNTSRHALPESRDEPGLCKVDEKGAVVSISTFRHQSAHGTRRGRATPCNMQHGRHTHPIISRKACGVDEKRAAVRLSPGINQRTCTH
jgi:hypothetical protein